MYKINDCLEFDVAGELKKPWLAWIVEYTSPVNTILRLPAIDREASLELLLHVTKVLDFLWNFRRVSRIVIECYQISRVTRTAAARIRHCSGVLKIVGRAAQERGVIHHPKDD